MAVWLKEFIKVAPVSGKELDTVFIWDFSKRLWVKGNGGRLLRPILSKILLKFAYTVKKTYFEWSRIAKQTLRTDMDAIPQGNEERKKLSQDIQRIQKVESSLYAFLKDFDTKTFQSKVILHAKSLLQTTSE